MKWSHKIWIISILFAHTTISQAQVTIGLESRPHEGALLDLKEQEATTEGGVTSGKGLLLPRVELQDLAKLQMGASSPDLTATGALEHTGLWVYNVTDKGDICPGVYVWDGALWQRFDKCWTLNLDQVGPLYFASGLNGSVITPQSVLVSWNPTTATLNVTDVDTSFTTHPLATGQTGGSTSLSIEPDPMLQASVDANPFATKESEVKLEATEDGKTVSKSIIINQINKALILDTPYKEYPTGGSKTGEKNKLTTNADFTVSYYPVGASNAISNLKLEGTALTLPYTASGYELNDGTGKSGNLLYDVTVGTSKARYSFVIFSDTQTPKRFADVAISVAQCNITGGLQPTIEESAKIGGFTQAEIDAVKATGVDSRILPNGLQMHRQVSSVRGANQIFLSSNFGDNPQDSDQRWMIHNLDAIEFDTEANYTGADENAKSTGKLSGPPYEVYPPLKYYTSASWLYPNGGQYGSNPNTYQDIQRLGLLYTWDAASAGKGGSNGYSNVDSGGISVNEVGSLTQKQRQGICPNGWHLPSDREWTDLENILVLNTSDFSASDDIGIFGTIPYGVLANDRGGPILCSAFSEICQYFNDRKGTSNSLFSDIRPGFEALFAGTYVNPDQINWYNGQAVFWTSSMMFTGVFNRIVPSAASAGIMQRNVLGTDFNSVRCKKNN